MQLQENMCNMHINNITGRKRKQLVNLFYYIAKFYWQSYSL